MNKFRCFWKITWKYDIRGTMFYNGEDDVDFKNNFIAYKYKQADILQIPSNRIITYMVTGKYYDNEY